MRESVKCVRTLSASRFGVNGHDNIERGRPDVFGSSVRQRGHSNAECHSRHSLWRWEKNHFNMHIAQKLCPHLAGARV